MTNIACIIPARGGSKGILNKNLLPLAGKPLIAWSIGHALASERINAGVFVSSDADDILALSTELGAQAIKRPDELATDSASSEAALHHAIDTITERNGQAPDLIVFLQCTSPLREKHDIDQAIATLEAQQADSLLSVNRVKDHFMWRYQDDVPTAINFDFKQRKRRQDIADTYLENGSIYVFSPEVLREHNNRLGGKIAMYEMAKYNGFQIDDADDILICTAMLEHQHG